MLPEFQRKDIIVVEIIATFMNLLMNVERIMKVQTA